MWNLNKQMNKIINIEYGGYWKWRVGGDRNRFNKKYINHERKNYIEVLEMKSIVELK